MKLQFQLQPQSLGENGESVQLFSLPLDVGDKILPNMAAVALVLAAYSLASSHQSALDVDSAYPPRNRYPFRDRRLLNTSCVRGTPSRSVFDLQSLRSHYVRTSITH
jgi:hypothetical protein